jgi:molybdopterin synthase sulfur carrier subunit
VINIVLFGRLSDFANEVNLTVEFAADNATPYLIRANLSLLNPALGEQLREPQILVSVNRVMVGWEQPISDGDEVAFLPPVTGG